MNCECGNKKTEVLETRQKLDAELGTVVHRRRHCHQCGTRFTTAEVRLDTARAAATSEALQDQYIVSFAGSTEV